MHRLLIVLVALALPLPATADEVVNVYSARHYDTDDQQLGERVQKQNA